MEQVRRAREQEPEEGLVTVIRRLEAQVFWEIEVWVVVEDWARQDNPVRIQVEALAVDAEAVEEVPEEGINFKFGILHFGR